MFVVTDSEGVEINIKDLVAYVQTQTEMFHPDTDTEVVGVVIGFPLEGLVQVQPKEGAPVEMAGSSCTVKESIVAEIADLSNDEELQAVLEGAEARFNEEVKNTSKKKRSSGGGGGGKPKVVGTIKLEL